ncbi:MAG: MFS transporter [Solirubrobacteraceae bacterium]
MATSTAAAGGRTRTIAAFAAFGGFWGAWGAALPAVQRHAGADDGQLGLALLCIGAGALASMRPAGALVDRWGGPALPAALAAFGLAAVAPALAASPGALAAGLLVLGAASGAVDVAANAEGARTEALSGRAVLALAHGTFSAAVVGASLATGALRAAGAGPALVLGLAGLVSLAAAAGAAALPAAPRRRGARPRLRPVPRALLVLGGLCALAFFTENAWQSWGAVHLEDDLGASAAVGALAPALFAASAAASRFGVHALGGRTTDRVLLAGGAARGAAGTLLGALAPAPAPALAGIALAGAGVSACAPVLLSRAGAAAGPALRGAAVSVATSIAYLGFLVGPAAVGLLARATTLPTSLAAVAGVAALLAVAAARAAATR